MSQGPFHGPDVCPGACGMQHRCGSDRDGDGVIVCDRPFMHTGPHEAWMPLGTMRGQWFGAFAEEAKCGPEAGGKA